MLHRSLSLLVFGALAASPVLAQAVISTHSGIINLAEGSVSIDSQPFEQKPGKFAGLSDGSTLRTEAGRAEVLLTPNVILRIGANSAIRMVSSSYADTRVGFLSGSAILESGESADTPVTILYQDYDVQSRENSTYRFDSASPGLTVLKGKAKVSLTGQSIVIGKDHAVKFTGALRAQEVDDPADDVLDKWARDRDLALAADNDALNKTTDDLSVAEDWTDDSGVGSLYSGVSPSLQGGQLSPYSVSPNAAIGSVYPAPLSPYDTYSTLSAYPIIEPGFPFYPLFVPVIVRPGGSFGSYPLRPVSIFGSRPLPVNPPIWRPRAPTTVGITVRPLASRPSVISAPHVITAPHVGIAGHR